MSNIYVKFGVGGLDLSSLHEKIWYAIKVISQIWGDEDVIIASTWEGTHLPWSKHYRKEAIDVGAPEFDVLSKITELKTELSPDFDVVFESDHVHVEWDPK